MDGPHSHDRQALTQFHETKQLERGERVGSGLLGVLLTCAGVAAVFVTENEIGTGALMLAGFAFLLIAVLGHVPRFSVAGTTVDPEQYVVRIRNAEELGRREGRDEAQVVVDSADDSEASEALEAWRAEQEAAAMPSPRGSRDAPQLRTSRVPDPRLSAELIAMLQRFARVNAVNDHFGVASALLDLGYKPELPKGRGGAPAKVAYIRWTVPNPSVTLYQNSAGLISDSKPQLDFALGIEIGRREGSEHPKVRFYYRDSSVDEVVDAARRFRDQPQQ